MTEAQFDAAFRGFCRRRPFRAFMIEFDSGSQSHVGHPEVIRQEGNLYMMRRVDGGYMVFTPASVSRLFDLQVDSITEARG